EMEDHLRIERGDRFARGDLVADVATAIVEHFRDARRFEEARLRGRLERVAAHLRTEAREPERKPASLEAGMAGDEDALVPPRGRVDAHHAFQGARPLDHSSSRTFLSRSVSIGCQNPSWRYARNSPSRDRRSSGSCSQMSASPFR